jgi:hypothetical protein
VTIIDFNPPARAPRRRERITALILTAFVAFAAALTGGAREARAIAPPCTCDNTAMNRDCGGSNHPDFAAAFARYDGDNMDGTVQFDMTTLNVDQPAGVAREYCTTVTTSATQNRLAVVSSTNLTVRCGFSRLDVDYSVRSTCAGASVLRTGIDLDGGSRGFTYFQVSPSTTYRVCKTLAVIGASCSTPAAGNNWWTFDASETVITSPLAGTRILPSSPVRGTALPAHDVEVYDNGTRVGTVRSDAGGNWTFTSAMPLALGMHSFRAAVMVGGRPVYISPPVAVTVVACLGNTDCAGSTPICEMTTFTCRACMPSRQAVDCPAPDAPICASAGASLGRCVAATVAITTAPSGNVLDRRPPVGGTATPNLPVAVIVDGREVARVTADASGNWSYTPPIELSYGAHSYSAAPVINGSTGSPVTPRPFTVVECLTNTQCVGGRPICDTNACRACAPATQAVDCASASAPFCSTLGSTAGQCVAAAVTITNAPTGAVTARRPPVSGTATPGLVVAVFIDNREVGRVTADAAGAWSFTPTADLDLGAHVYSAGPVIGTGVGTRTRDYPFTVVQCNANADCGGATPFCNTTTHVCRGCSLATEATDCAAPTPACATAGTNLGRCVACTSNMHCLGASPVCNTTTNLCVGDSDTDGDGLLNLDEVRIGTNPNNPDSDDDGVTDGVEVGPTLTRPRDTDMDMTMDALDNDDDGDTVLTRAERPGLTDRDADRDGIPDYRDADDDNDSLPTAVEVRLDMAPNDDADMDGTPSYLDTDSDNDGVNDGFEAGRDATTPQDTDRDMTADFVDEDDDGDTIPTRQERPGGTNFDTDRDAQPDYLDADDDNDAIPTAVEARLDMTNGDDFDGDGIPSYRDTDSDNDGVNDAIEAGRDATMPQDTDRDMGSDFIDADDDGDGVSTRDERPMSNDRDTDMDSTADYLDDDDDNDLIPTATENRLDSSLGRDFDMDGTPSYRDTDADGDTVLDRIEAGADPTMPADTDRDGSVDFLDRDSDNDCVPDNDPREAGAARTDASRPSMMANNNCPLAMPVCDTTRGVCGTGMDTDGDGLLDEVERRIGTNPNNPDGDSLRDGMEVGDPTMPRDTDMDTMIDPLDADDDGDSIPTREERGGGSMNRDTDNDGTPDHYDTDDDGDTIPTLVEATADGSTGDDTDMDGTPSYRDLDSDGDGVNDRTEAGSDPTMPSDTDRDMGADFLDTDDDGDGIATRDERPAGNDRDTDMDGIPDHRDADDDGDGIPTATENRLDTSPDKDFDRDNTPTYRDTDSDGDGVSDRTEAGSDPTMPADTDHDGAADFLDLDADNDCHLDSDPREMGAARTMVAANPDAACEGDAPVCNTSVGRCVGCIPASGTTASRGCEAHPAGRFCIETMAPVAGVCGCNTNTDCGSNEICNTSTHRCAVNPVPPPPPPIDATGDGLFACNTSNTTGRDDGSMRTLALTGLAVALVILRRRQASRR